MFTLETQHKQIPKRWIALMIVLGLPLAVVGTIGGNLTFTMRKFIESPATINSISSLDVLFNILIAVVCLYISDYIWTRRGRRSPFVLVAWACMAGCLWFIPMADSTLSIVSMLIMWLAFNDLAATFGILVMEIVPPKQRVWYGAWNSWVLNIFNLTMWLIVNGRFDDTLHTPSFPITGESMIYWLGAVTLTGGFLFLFFFVRERKPGHIPKLPAGGIIKGVTGSLVVDRSLWPVYLLAFSGILITTGLGAIDGLLITEQWAYSKQDMATNVFVGGVLNIALLPLLGWGLTRISLITGFLIGVVATLALKSGYYIFVQYGLPDQRPEIHHMILFGYPLALASTVLSIVTNPLIFDYIPRDKMGTAQAGLGVVRNITRLLTLNGVGLWVVWFSGLTMPEGGYDYFSGYLFMIGMEIVGCCFLAYFILQVRRGTIKPLGRVGFDSPSQTEESK